MDLKETNSVVELKKVLEGILKKCPEDLRLTYKGNVLDDTKIMTDCGLTKQTTKAQTPAVIGLVYRNIGKSSSSNNTD